MIQTRYITITCENPKKEIKVPTRIKLNHIGLPEGRGGSSFFSHLFWGEGGVVIREVDGGGGDLFNMI